MMTFSGFAFVARKRAAVVTQGNRALVATEAGTVRATNLESIILSAMLVYCCVIIVNILFVFFCGVAKCRRFAVFVRYHDAVRIGRFTLENPVKTVKFRVIIRKLQSFCWMIAYFFAKNASESNERQHDDDDGMLVFASSGSVWFASQKSEAWVRTRQTSDVRRHDFLSRECALLTRNKPMSSKKLTLVRLDR